MTTLPNANFQVYDAQGPKQAAYSKIVIHEEPYKSGLNFDLRHSGNDHGTNYSSASSQLGPRAEVNNSMIRAKTQIVTDPKTGEKKVRFTFAAKAGVDLSSLSINGQSIDLNKVEVQANKQMQNPQTTQKPDVDNFSTANNSKHKTQKPDVTPRTLKQAGVSITEPSPQQKNLYSKIITINATEAEAANFKINHSGNLNGTNYTDWRSNLATNETALKNDAMDLKKETIIDPNTKKKFCRLTIAVKNGVDLSKLNINDKNIDLVVSAKTDLAKSSDPLETSLEARLEPKLTTRSQDGFEISQNGLALRDSGSIQYPKGHSVFTVTTQDQITASHLVTKKEFSESLENKNSSYEQLRQGSPYIAKLADNMQSAQTQDTLYSVLKQTSQQTDIEFANPLHRISEDALKQADQDKELEVLIITGRGYEGIFKGKSYSKEDDERRFLFSAKLFKHGIDNSKFEDKCKEFQHLRNPSINDIETAIRERAISARENNRRLMVVYLGHGTLTNENTSQLGIQSNDYYREGSKTFRFCTENSFNEDDYKKLLEKYLSDIETIHVIGGCHSGAALSMTKPLTALQTV